MPHDRAADALPKMAVDSGRMAGAAQRICTEAVDADAYAVGRFDGCPCNKNPRLSVRQGRLLLAVDDRPFFHQQYFAVGRIYVIHDLAFGNARIGSNNTRHQ